MGDDEIEYCLDGAGSTLTIWILTPVNCVVPYLRQLIQAVEVNPGFKLYVASQRHKPSKWLLV